jgi:hypothetical protein
MTNEEKLAKLRLMLDEGDDTSDAIANAYLEAAEKAVINLVYPFGDVSEKTMPERYEYEQIEIAAYMLNKRGAEGETAHTEGGTSRTFETGDIPISLRARITAYAGGF